MTLVLFKKMFKGYTNNVHLEQWCYAFNVIPVFDQLFDKSAVKINELILDLM